MPCGLGIRRPGADSFLSWPSPLLWAETCAKYPDRLNPQSLPHES